MEGQPHWASWEYAKPSTPQAFDGDGDEFYAAIEWIISAPPLNIDETASLGYSAVSLWVLGSGLMYRDLVHLFKIRKSFPEAAARVKMYAGARAIQWRRQIEKTTEILTIETKAGGGNGYKTAEDEHT